MALDLSAIEGRYHRDILDQPQALENTLLALGSSPQLKALAAGLSSGRFTRVVLTGMGSSFHGLHPLNLELIEAGFTPVMAETSEFIHHMDYLIDRRTLIVAVSQSGRSAETVRLLEINRRCSPIIGVTNTPDSPLARQADAVLMTDAGPEFSVSCKTYVSGLLALRWLGAVLCGGGLVRLKKELAQAAPASAAYLADWKDHVRGLAGALEGIRDIFLVGRGASLAAAGTGALIIKEADHFHAEGMSSAAFRHGPFEMLGPAIFVAAFSGGPKTRALSAGLAKDIRKRGGAGALVGEASAFKPFRLPAAPASVLPLMEILPAQMITLALAALAGREPGRFTLASKVTTTE